MVPAHSKRDISLEYTHKHTALVEELFPPLNLQNLSYSLKTSTLKTEQSKFYQNGTISKEMQGILSFVYRFVPAIHGCMRALTPKQGEVIY